MPQKHQCVRLYEICLDMIVEQAMVACVNFSAVIDQLKLLKQADRRGSKWSTLAFNYRQEVEDYILCIPVLCADDYVRKLMVKFDCFYADFFGMFLHPSTKIINIQLTGKGKISSNIVEALLNNLDVVTKIKQLVIPYSGLSLEPKKDSKDKNLLLRFLKRLRRMTNLFVLDISHMTTNEMLVSLGRYCHKLENLSICNSPALEKGALKKILKLKSLVYIDVRANQSRAINSHELVLCLENLPNLKVLKHGNWTPVMNVIQARGKINAPYGITELFLIAPRIKQLRVMMENFPDLVTLNIVSCEVPLDRLTALTKVKDLTLSDVPFPEALKLFKCLNRTLVSLCVSNMENFDAKVCEKKNLTHTCFTYLSSLSYLEMKRCDNVDLPLIRTCCPLLNSLVIDDCSAGSIWSKDEVIKHLNGFTRSTPNDMPDLVRLSISGRFLYEGVVPMIQACHNLDYLKLGDSSRSDMLHSYIDQRFFQAIFFVNKLMFLEELQVHSETLSKVSLISLLESLDNLKNCSFNSSRWSAMCSKDDIQSLSSYRQRYNMRLQLFDTHKEKDLLETEDVVISTFVM